jgi:hypothetical protein
MASARVEDVETSMADARKATPVVDPMSVDRFSGRQGTFE